jgi:hypothetical protein
MQAYPGPTWVYDIVITRENAQELKFQLIDVHSNTVEGETTLACQKLATDMKFVHFGLLVSQGFLYQVSREQIRVKHVLYLYAGYGDDIATPLLVNKFITVNTLDYFYEVSEVPGANVNNLIQVGLENRLASGVISVDNLYGVRLWEGKLSRGGFLYPGYSGVGQ